MGEHRRGSQGTYISGQLGKKPPKLSNLFTLIGLNVGVMGAWGLQEEAISEWVGVGESPKRLGVNCQGVNSWGGGGTELRLS